MITVRQVYEAMQAIAPLELAESWDNPGLLVDCGGAVHRVLTALDITPEVVEEAAAKQCEMIVSHHPVIFDPLKRLGPQDVPFQLVRAGISAVCMHTNLDAAEGGVNEVLAGIFGMKDMETFAEDCGRVGTIEEITVPELASKAQQELAVRCNAPVVGPAVQVKFADAGRPVKRLAVISGAGGSLFADARHGGRLPADRRSQPSPCHRRKAAGAFAHCCGPLRHRIPGDRRCGGKAACRPAGAGRAGEHRKPGPVYVFVRESRCYFLQRFSG